MDSLDEKKHSSEDEQEENVESVQFCKLKKKSKQKFDHYQIWVKSSYDHENNHGSWCFISIDDKKDIVTITGTEENTDKNKIQLIPLLEALEWFNDESSQRKKQITIFTTSNYLVGSIGEWIDKWRKNNFMINEEKERPNADILRKIDVIKHSLNLSVKYLMKENDFSQKAEELSCSSLENFSE